MRCWSQAEPGFGAKASTGQVGTTSTKQALKGWGAFRLLFSFQNSSATDVSEWALQGEAVLCFHLL